MFTRPLNDVFEVCLSIVSFSVLIDILISRLHSYLNREITKFQNGAMNKEVYKPLIQRFGKYMSLIDAVLNILVANLIGVVSPRFLNFVFWVSVVILIIDIVVLLPRYHKLVAKIEYVKAKSRGCYRN